MEDKGKSAGEKILKQLENEAYAKLDTIRNSIMSSGKSVDESTQILIDVIDELDDILLHWEDTYVPDMLRILDKDDDLD